MQVYFRAAVSIWRAPVSHAIINWFYGFFIWPDIALVIKAFYLSIICFRIHRFTISVSVLSSYYPFSGCCWSETKKFQVNLCFKSIKYSVQAADDFSQVILQTFPLNLVLYISKLVLYFNSIIISNQIKYYLARNKGNFLQIKYGFFRHVLPLSTVSSDSLLLKQHVPRT